MNLINTIYPTIARKIFSFEIYIEEIGRLRICLPRRQDIKEIIFHEKKNLSGTLRIVKWDGTLNN